MGQYKTKRKHRPRWFSWGFFEDGIYNEHHEHNKSHLYKKQAKAAADQELKKYRMWTEHTMVRYNAGWTPAKKKKYHAKKPKPRYSKEEAWIRKKLRSGVSQNELRESVGMFSNKNKNKAMAQKGLNEDAYKKRYSFLANVYYLLSNKKY